MFVVFPKLRQNRKREIVIPDQPVDQSRLAPGLNKEQGGQRTGSVRIADQVLPVLQFEQVMADVLKIIPIVWSGMPAAGTFLPIRIEDGLVQRLDIAGNTHGVVMQQVVQGESPLDFAVSPGLLLKLDERALEEVDEEFPDQ